MKKSKLRKLINHSVTFYTYWAVVFHLLFILGVVPNTFIIAVIVLVVSQVFVWIWPGHARQLGSKPLFWANEIIFHWLPVVVFVISDQMMVSWESIVFAGCSLGVYVLYHGKKEIVRFYSDLSQTVYHLWN